MTRVLIRCDASLLIGSGHVMRCRTLARELHRHGAEVIFLCRRQSGDLIHLLEYEFQVLALPEQPLVACDELEGRDLYNAWLGCSQDQDAAHCLRVLAEAGITNACWLIADHYGLDACWEEQLLAGLAFSNAPPKLLVIDDLADRLHQANLLLDQNFFGEVTEQRYQELLPPQCCQLLGPNYALLGREYAQLHPLVPPRNKFRRVLVFFGGVDTSNLTGRALEALMDPSLSDLVVDVVLGLHSPNHQAVSKLVSRRPNTNMHGPLPSLAGLISRADLAIGAGGTTTWERLCLGLPCLVVVAAANQQPFVEALDQAGHLRLLGNDADVSVDHIRSALLNLLAEPEPENSFFSLTDGWGASRLVTAMLGPNGPISLRPAMATDQALMSHWANDPQVRINNLSTEMIATVDNHNLFQKGLANPNHCLQIVTTADGCPIGQFLLDRQCSRAHGFPNRVRVGLSLDRSVHGHELVSEVVRLGFQVIEQHSWPEIDTGVVVSNGNTASDRCFAEAVFSPELELALDFSRGTGSDSLAMASGCITLLSDRGSWLNAFLPKLVIGLWQRGHAVRWIHSPEELRPGDVCLLLSCSRLLKPEQLALHQHNLVVHASALPQGQGWSPMTWQILEGSTSVPLTLFEAVVDLDAGSIYRQLQIELEGHELAVDWRSLLAQATSELCLSWFDRYQEVVNAAQPQHGTSSYYRRRRPADSQLDPEISLAQQFNLLRVVDNSSYPAFFYWRNHRYDLLIRRS